ncbi:MAG: VCBS repeat-containing protein [Planctomycetes bacterium]|nr:VCBS repeat-containing protein [Planctomycetota bacterium]
MKSILPLFFAASSASAQICFERDPALPVVGGSGTRIALGDFDADGDLDLATTTWDHQTFNSTLRTRLNLGDGSWSGETSYTIPLTIDHLGFVDVDGDGADDLLVAAYDLYLRRSLGASGFGPAVTLLAGPVGDVVAADLDNDGDLDLAVSRGGEVVILHNQGSGTFIAVPGPQGDAVSIAVGDFDGDGYGDLAVVDIYLHELRITLNDGAGGFPGTPALYGLSMTPRFVLARDLNGDGLCDVAVGHSAGRINVLIRTPGGFAPGIEYPLGHQVFAMTAADLDDDGDVDLAAIAYGDLSILLNAGAGSFAVSVLDAGDSAGRLARGDLDADGDEDLALLGISGAVPWRNCARSGTPTCFGDGSASACPCGNASPVGADAGCLHSLGTAGTLRAGGATSLAADSLVLRGALMPNAPALYFQGTSAIDSGLGSVFGDGLRCAGGSVTRLGIATNSGGTSRFPDAGQQAVSLAGGVAVPGERHYQVWYRNAASFCTPAGFNLTNALRVVWRP